MKVNGKIELASQVFIDQYEDLADSFLKQVFEIEGALVTDESSLYDFKEFGTKSVQPYLDKIKLIYKIDVSDIEGLNLAKILQRISILGKEI